MVPESNERNNTASISTTAHLLTGASPRQGRGYDPPVDRRLFAVPPLLALLALALVGSGAGAQADRESSHVRLGAAAAPAKAPPARSLASATGTDRRYALANGCYALRSPSAGGFVVKSAGGYGTSAASVGEAEGFRMQATALGSYLFYGRDRDFMAADALNVVAPAGGASPDADWRVDANPDGTFAITLPSKGKALAVAAGRLVLADPAAPVPSASSPPTAARCTRRWTRAPRARPSRARRRGARSRGSSTSTCT